MSKKKDITGNKYGKLTAISQAGRRKYPCGAYLSLWRCLCDCGNTTIVPLTALQTGNTKSCGCMGSRNFVGTINKTHGQSHTRLNEVWKRMKARCNNKNTRDYKWYGAKGVRVCEEWSKSFESFRDFMLSNGYDENAPRGEYTIDRINPFGDYEPSNCRVVSMKEQRKNKRNDYVNRRYEK